MEIQITKLIKLFTEKYMLVIGDCYLYFDDDDDYRFFFVYAWTNSDTDIDSINK